MTIRIMGWKILQKRQYSIVVFGKNLNHCSNKNASIYFQEKKDKGPKTKTKIATKPYYLVRNMPLYIYK